MSKQYWFRPKSFGLGATPITWEGWAFTLGMMAVSIAAIVTAILAETQRWPHYRVDQLACLIVFVVIQWILIKISLKKTDGDWR